MGINISSSNNYSERFPIDGSSMVALRKTKIQKWRQVVDTWSAEYYTLGRTTCELDLTKTISKHEEQISISIHDHPTDHAKDNFDFQMSIRVKEDLLLNNFNLNGPRSTQQLPERKTPIAHGGVLMSSSFLYGSDTDRKGLIVFLRAKRNDESGLLPYVIAVKHYFVAACCSHGVSVVAKIRRGGHGGLSVELEKPSKEHKHDLLSMFDDVQGKGWCPDPSSSDCPIEIIPSQNKNPANANPGHQNPTVAIGNGGYFEGNGNGSTNNNPLFNNNYYYYYIGGYFKGNGSR